ncbi:MAG: hypothetical protein EB127_17945, partial [Alphaproteobacteria bacterium]|nr:hypothetical protein [Alphaproteobacteria bacterium]
KITSTIIHSMKPKRSSISKLSIITVVAVITLLVAFIFTVVWPSRLARPESFSTASTIHKRDTTTVYTTMQLNNMKWVKAVVGDDVIFRGLNSDSSYSTFKNVVMSNSSNDTELLREADINGPILFIADPYEKDTFLSKYKVLSSSPAGYFIAFGLPSKTYPMSCSFELAGRTIGFLTATDEAFINAILHGYRINKDDVRMKKIELQGTAYYAEELIRDIDIVITFVIPKSAFHIWLISQKVAIMGFKKLDWNRVNLFYPYTTMKEVRLKELLMNESNVDVTAIISDNENRTMLPSMDLMLFQILDSVKPTKPNIEKFITRLSLSPESLDPTYRCYGDVTIETKALCDSPYDEVGDPKPRNTVWDHPCILDTDCPYYKSNKNYKNKRGGCGKNGLCELPIGVRRTSFRKYDDIGIFAPFCYGCDAYDTECCGRQSKPDYAFTNDASDRRSSHLKTSIPMN